VRRGKKRTTSFTQPPKGGGKWREGRTEPIQKSAYSITSSARARIIESRKCRTACPFPARRRVSTHIAIPFKELLSQFATLLLGQARSICPGRRVLAAKLARPLQGGERQFP